MCGSGNANDTRILWNEPGILWNDLSFGWLTKPGIWWFPFNPGPQSHGSVIQLTRWGWSVYPTLFTRFDTSQVVGLGISEPSTVLLVGGFKYLYFHPYLGKIPILTHIFQRGWFNHQLDYEICPSHDGSRDQTISPFFSRLLGGA